MCQVHCEQPVQPARVCKPAHRLHPKGELRRNRQRHPRGRQPAFGAPDFAGAERRPEAPQIAILRNHPGQGALVVKHLIAKWAPNSKGNLSQTPRASYLRHLHSQISAPRLTLVTPQPPYHALEWRTGYFAFAVLSTLWYSLLSPTAPSLISTS